MDDSERVFEKQIIKSLINPPEWGGLGGIKKVADTGLVASGGGTEAEGGQGVASGRLIQGVSKQELENRYQRRLISRLYVAEPGPGPARRLGPNGEAGRSGGFPADVAKGFLGVGEEIAVVGGLD